MDQTGIENPSFEFCPRKQDGKDKKYVYKSAPQECQRVPPPLVHPPEQVVVIEKEQIQIRHTWNNGLEFLMSCIAMSVGLGNVWRFPFAVYENGGGAFLIPYFIVLFVIGKPFYFLEMIMGQFSSTSCIKVWTRIPALRGIGCAQAYSMFCLSTYYCAIMGVTVIYFIASFSSVLPWAECLEEWRPNCMDSSNKIHPNVSLVSNSSDMASSAEMYFVHQVLKQAPSLEDGLGLPDWKLVLAVASAWICIGGILIGGVKSSGKAAYFLALFPYVIMFCLLIRACTLKGAAKGIIFFIKPTWSKLLEVDVWFAAITQCFFSLSIVFGALIMYASYNNFSHNIYRDVTVVTILDTFTSLIAGFTIFGILGNLATEMNIDNIDSIVKSGASLAFISYPDAISKFDYIPQLFSVAFFLMLYVLGIGSGVGIIGGVITVINDQFPKWKHSYIVIAYSIVGFLIGIVYCTSNGQAALEIVDHYACSFIVFSIAAFEIGGIFWIYGLEHFLDDVEYMLKKRPSIYWRICWTVVTPLTIIGIFIYSVVNLSKPVYNKEAYPQSVYTIGNFLMLFGVLQIPIWAIYTIFTLRKKGFYSAFMEAFSPGADYGPRNVKDHQHWEEFKDKKRKIKESRTSGWTKQFLYVLLGRENRLQLKLRNVDFR